ncbi:MAG: hypothetical protein M5R36_29620 [Deltaproteobacteria bacterium]|nr:hypothetical protein [Deltaproteobacteria bacterium]
MTIRWMTMASMIMALGAFAACGCGDDDDDDAGGDDDTSDDDGDDDDTEPGDDDVDDDDVDDDVDDDTGDDDTGPPPDDYLAPWPQSNIESHPYDESPTAGDIRMKAEAYNEWIEDNYLPDYGGHVHVKYTDDTLTTPLYYHGFGDSGMWTGVFGATQAMRYHATGSLTAKENAIRMIYALINNVHVTGRPGFTARYRAPKTSLIYSYYGGDAWCDGDENCHHIESGEYAGDFWIGNTSRDMYIGWYFRHGHGLRPDRRRRVAPGHS